MKNDSVKSEDGCLSIIGKGLTLGLIFGFISLLSFDMEDAWITFIFWFIVGIIMFGYKYER